MNLPPGLFVAACALWGAQTGQWLIAALVAAAFEAPRFMSLRWNVTQPHFNRLSDFCSVLIVATGVYLYATYGNPRALMLLFQWLPLLLAPLAAAQAWGNLREVDVAAFVWTLRKDPSAERQTLNLGYPYLAVWIIAASASNAPGPVFYFGLAALVAWALWSARPQRYPLALWLVLLVAATGAGYSLQGGLHQLQGWFEEVVPEWLSASGSRTDPYRSRTDLGHIGSLKEDGAIVLRVRAEGGLKAPLLLHRASYNGYFNGTWSARGARLEARLPEEATRWALARDPAPPSALATVYDYSPRGNPVLSLPTGTVELRDFHALSIRINALGTVQADSPPGFFSYVAAVSPDTSIDEAPGDEDRRIPQGEQALFDGITTHLALKGLAPEQAAAAVKRYFANGFGYSTYRAAGSGGSMLADFLLRTRAGHCEYFATATVLLLRAAGIPARYATGFSVQEYSRLEDAYIVRVRHAHAWTKAWIGGRWVDLDTTPPSWVTVESAEASWWSPAGDLWAWLRFRLSQFGGSRDEERTATTVIVAALLIGLWFGWRLYQQRRLMVFGRSGASRTRSATTPGKDSELFLVERALASTGLGREPGETVMAWIARIELRLPAGRSADALREIAVLHYRYRFDPAGLPALERERLRGLAAAWLNRTGAPA